MYILGTEDRHLPHETGLACPYLHDFCLGCHSTVPAESFSWQLFASFQKWPKNRWNFLRDFWPKNLSRKLSQERLKKKKSIFRRCFVWDWKKAFTILAFFFFFDPSLVGIIFKKAFKKNKNIERLKFLGRKLSPEGGQIPHCTRLVQHLSVNHCRWSVA